MAGPRTTFDEWWDEDGGYWGDGDPKPTGPEYETARRAWDTATAVAEGRWRAAFDQVSDEFLKQRAQAVDLARENATLRVAARELDEALGSGAVFRTGVGVDVVAIDRVHAARTALRAVLEEP
jgi:hypothetical protein